MRRPILLSTLLVLALVAVMLPAKPALAASILGFNSYGCTLEVYFSVAAGDPTGNYTVEIWDDYQLIKSATINVTGAGTYMASLLIPNPWPAIPGIGVSLVDPSNSYVDGVDPYFPDIDPTCGAGPDMVPIPPGSVVGEVKVDTPLYFAPRADALTGATLSAGKTIWVLGKDASGQYYQVLLSGNYLWVPANTLGPNDDEVWHGMPLPTTVVG